MNGGSHRDNRKYNSHLQLQNTMATFLDIGLLQHFSVIFPFLLVFVGSYALLLKLKLISEDKGINAIIALALASMTLLSDAAVQLITTASPWFVVLFMFLLFLVLIFRFMGVKEDTITGVMESGWEAPHWIILVIIILIVMGSIGVVFGPGLLEVREQPSQGQVINQTIPPGQTGDFNQNIVNVAFHPKVVGLISLLLIALFAIRTLAYGKPGAGEK